MILQSLQLINYRCFKDSGVVPLSKFNVFIGRNDGGKSSALTALHKLLAEQPFDDDDHRKEPTADEAEPLVAEQMEVRVRLADGSGHTHHYRCVRRLGPNGGPAHVAFEIESDCVDVPDLNQDFGSLKLQELKDLCGKHELMADGPQNQTASFLRTLQMHRETLPKHKDWMEAPREFRREVPQAFRYAEGNEADPQEAIRKTLAEYFRLSVLPEHRKSLETAKAQVQDSLNSEAQKYVPVLIEHCPTVESIAVDLGESSFENVQISQVRITQKGGTPVDWHRIGRGKRREMSLAVFRFSADLLADALENPPDATQPRVVAALFDEPDLNLDYDAQRRVSQILRKLGEYPQCQVLVATHSINLIDSTPLQEICFFGFADEDPSTARVSCFDPGDDAQVLDTLRDGMGLRNSSFFNEKLFLVQM